MTYLSDYLNVEGVPRKGWRDYVLDSLGFGAVGASIGSAYDLKKRLAEDATEKKLPKKMWSSKTLAEDSK